MFKTIITATKRPAITISVDGRSIEAHEGDTLAIALLSAGVAAFRRTPVSGAPACAAVPDGCVLRLPGGG